jgi:hypothetical protein
MFLPISVLGCPLKEVVLQKATPNWRKKKEERNENNKLRASYAVSHTEVHIYSPTQRPSDID